MGESMKALRGLNRSSFDYPFNGRAAMCCAVLFLLRGTIFITNSYTSYLVHIYFYNILQGHILSAPIETSVRSHDHRRERIKSNTTEMKI